MKTLQKPWSKSAEGFSICTGRLHPNGCPVINRGAGTFLFPEIIRHSIKSVQTFCFWVWTQVVWAWDPGHHAISPKWEVGL